MPHVSTSPDGLPMGDGAAHMAIILARLEGKVDTALARQTAQLDEHGRRLADVEVRLRAVEARPVVPPAIEDRLRAVETRPVVSPAAMWSGVGTIVAAVGVAVPLINRLAG